MTNFPLLAVFVESKIGYASTFYYSCWFPKWSLNFVYGMVIYAWCVSVSIMTGITNRSMRNAEARSVFC